VNSDATRPVDPPGALARAGAKGALWQGLAHAVGKSIVLVTTIVLARLLSPQEYGLVAAALVLMAYAEAVADAGVAQALIYFERSREAARAALLVSVVTGTILATAAFLSAPLIADFFGHPDVAPLARVLAASLLATSLGAVPEALLRRGLLFQRLTVAAVMRAVVSGLLTMGLAFAGYGAWSLAIGTVAGTVAYAMSCWLLLPDTVPLKLWKAQRTHVRATVAYGAPVAGSALLAKLIFDIDYLVVGRLEGAEALGFYTLAFRLPEFLIISVFFVLSSVLFPLYARARDDRERLRRGYLHSVQIQALYGVTAGVGLAMVAPYLVPVLFGEKWNATVPVLMLLSLYAAVRSLGVGANEVYKAVGRPGLSIWISVIRLVILLPALIIAARWGIVGVAAAQLVVSLFFVVGMQTVAARVMQLRARQLLTAVVPALACGALVAVVGWLGSLLSIGRVPSLVVIVLAAVAAVYGLLRLAYPTVLAGMVGLAIPARSR
jgi:lipopolysaccharide exporter